MKAVLFLVLVSVIVAGCDDDCKSVSQTCDGAKIVTCSTAHEGDGFDRQVSYCPPEAPVCVSNGQNANCVRSAAPCVGDGTCEGAVRTYCIQVRPPTSSDASPQTYRSATDCSRSRTDGGLPLTCALASDGKTDCVPPPAR